MLPFSCRSCRCARGIAAAGPLAKLALSFGSACIPALLPRQDAAVTATIFSGADMTTSVDLQEVGTLARRFLANPYVDPTVHKQASEALTSLLSRSERIVADLKAAKSYSDARRVVTAFMFAGFLNARSRYDKWPDPMFAVATYESLELPYEGVAQVVAAALRCQTELARFQGTSAAASATRAAVWRSCFGDSVYESMKLRRLIHEQNVLLLGETGTGKEILARAIQAGNISAFGVEPRMASVNAAAIPSDLLESELFGHVKAAFTGAERDRIGQLEAVHSGTVFLDEIADLPMGMQPKLLRALQERRVTPVGSNDERTADVRVVSATSQPLETLIADRRFRIDLYERLAGTVIRVPPLRERREDIHPIAHSMVDRIEQAAREAMAGAGEISSLPGALIASRAGPAIEAFADRKYDWPGNVRELENELRARLLGFEGGSWLRRKEADDFLKRVLACEVTQADLVSWYSSRVLGHCDGNITKAAEILGIDRNTLARKSKKE